MLDTFNLFIEDKIQLNFNDWMVYDALTWIFHVKLFLLSNHEINTEFLRWKNVAENCVRIM